MKMADDVGFTTTLYANMTSSSGGHLRRWPKSID